MSVNSLEMSSADILMVSRNSVSVSVLADQLTQQGHQIFFVKTVKQAMAFCEQTPPDLILVDTQMPKGAGWNFCKRLKAKAKTCSIPVILMGELETESEIHQVFAVQAADWIHPRRIPEALARIETQLCLQQTRQHNQQLQRDLQACQVHVNAETELRTLFGAMDDVVIVLDWDGRCLKIAPTRREKFFEDPDQQIGKLLHEVLPPAEAEFQLKYTQQAIATQQPIENVEYSMQFDDEEKWFVATVSPLSNRAAVWVSRDITVLKQVESALQQSRERFQKLAENIPGTIYEFLWRRNQGMRCPYVSSGCQELYELDPETFQADFTTGLNQLHPDDRQSFEESLQASALTLQPWSWKGRIKGAKSGQIKWVQAASRPEKLANGDILWRGLMMDISDRQDTLFQLHERNELLQREIQKRQRIDALLDDQNHILEMIATSASLPQVFETLSLSVERHSQQALCSFLMLDSYGRLRLIAAPSLPTAYNQAIDGMSIGPQAGSCGTAAFRKETVIVSDIATDPLWSSFRELALSFGLRACWSIPILSARSEVLGALALYYREPKSPNASDRDLIAQAVHLAKVALDHYHAETALRDALQAAEAANRAKSQFLANMSHELRTPLNAILGFTQVMNRDLSLHDIHGEHLEIIGRSGEHLLSLIDDILSLSKIEAGRVSLNEQNFDLYHLLDTLAEMFRLKAEAKGLFLSVNRSPEVPPYIRADEVKLRQVLINLISNAIKFTERGSVTVQVQTPKTAETGRWESDRLILNFSVIDTGPGIAPNELDTLFNPFVQTETGRKSQEGTGLGLPISRQFIHLMGGDITVQSTIHQGTTFQFQIPIQIAQSADIPQLIPKRKVIGLEPNQPQYRILVVDDRPENSHLLQKLLTPLGFAVRTAANGQEAIAIWDSWSPHLIWMDMRMPVMDGYEATHQIKSHLKGQATAIIALTASAFEEERAAVLAVGCNDFVRKPFREEVIFEKIASHLGVRYIYAESEVSGISKSQTHWLDWSTLKSQISQMPLEWLQHTHEASLQADSDLLMNLITQIPEENPELVQALTDLTDNFQFDQLIELTQPPETSC